ncbi:hypothetical protein KKG22_02050 [Patescibacteria group bacterium]|nr:hypothetical protein [Patescibacteria group bacterium]MBU1721865.1 hypothetical protein [Patescibacteria group bacterium]MBU1901323.1 hypothetical protein [Patescibacteria group bacterium]
MKYFPPHLPPKACHIRLRRTYESLPWVFMVVILAIVSGFAATMVAIAWVVPNPSMMYQPFISSNYTHVTEETPQLDSFVQQQVAQRMVQIFDTREKLSGGYYTKNALLGHAIVLSNEGWATVMIPQYTRGMEQYMEVVDHQGHIASVETVIQDPMSDVLYIQLRGEGFRGDVHFPDWEEITPGNILWSVVDTETPITIGSSVPMVDQHTIVLSQETQALELDAGKEIDALINQPLVTDRGAFVGFMREDGTLLPSWYMATQLASLFDQGVIAYSGIPLKGQVVSYMQTEEGSQTAIEGFYISFVPYQLAKSTLRIGDVILTVQGRPFHAQTIAKDILTSGTSTITFQVLRGSEVLDIEVEKVAI